MQDTKFLPITRSGKIKVNTIYFDPNLIFKCISNLKTKVSVGEPIAILFRLVIQF